MKRILLTALCIAGLMVTLTACNPQEVSKDAIRQNFPQDQHGRALAVAQCESGLNPKAVSAGGGNWGLFQINRVHRPLVESMGYSWEQITDPFVNAKVARSLFDRSGWSPWSCA